MSNFLFTVVPAMGHLNPTLPIAVELKKRGHGVGYAIGEDFRKNIEAESLAFFPAGPPGLKSNMSSAAQKVLKHTGMLSNYYFFKALAEACRETLPDILAVIDSFAPDVIIADAITHAGALAAQARGLPWATNHPLPGLIPSQDAPPFTAWGLPPAKNFVVQATYSIIRGGQKVFFSLFNGDFNRLRASQGLPPMGQAAIMQTLSPYLIIIPTVEGFEYKRSDWPAQAHLIGPSPWGKAESADHAYDWIESLPQDRPLIYVTMGTFQIYRSLHFFTKVIEALKDSPYTVVIGAGKTAQELGFHDIPPHIRIETFVPHAKILPRATAVIHHGGQGIAQDSIYNGLPAVVVPVSQDLFEVARRCTQAGTAVTIPYNRLTAKGLLKALKHILTDGTTQRNTRALQDVFTKTNAGATGAGLLETLANTRAPVYRSA